MKTWKVKPIQVGGFVLPKSTIIKSAAPDEEITIPIWIAAIYGNDKNILVDTGIHDLKWCQEYREPGTTQTEDEKTLVALKREMGWDPEDVDIVVNTHLHFDHTGMNSAFRNSKFYVQRKEYEVAMDRTPSEQTLYHLPLYDKKAVSYLQWQFVDGEYDLDEGVRLIPTPGHTYGHQSVLVMTEEGTVCVAGDVVNTYRNIEFDEECGFMADKRALFDSYRLIRQTSEFIIPGHEPSIVSGSTSGFPTL